LRDSPSAVSDISESSTSALQLPSYGVGLRAPQSTDVSTRSRCDRPLSRSLHVTSTPQRTQVTVSPMGIASDHHSTDAEVRHPTQRDTCTHIDKCARPNMDTWNVTACLLGQAGWPARLREPECPRSEQCKGSCVPRRRLEEGTPMYACHGPARTRRASATRSSRTCSTG
jgi:hypothetical protein